MTWYVIAQRFVLIKNNPRAWYERLHNYLVKISFEKMNDNNNIYLKNEKGKGILLVEIFVDDIIFEGHDTLCKIFADEMMKEYEMSMFGEMKFFVGLQINHYTIQLCEGNTKKFLYGGFKLSKNDDSTKVNQTIYKFMISKLQYDK